MSITLPAFTPAQESLFITLGGRAALDSRLPRPFLGDTMADEILTTVGYDLAKFPSLNTKLDDAKSTLFEIAVRAKRLDEVVHRYVVQHPNAIVLDLGAGLERRLFRVNPPPTVGWYDIDFPVVDALRRQLLPHAANAHSLGADLADPDWLDDIPTGRRAVIVADGSTHFSPRKASYPC